MSTESEWRDQGEGRLWISHWNMTPQELSNLTGVERLTLWNVRFPAGETLAQIPTLRWLDIRGGASSDLNVVEGCSNLQGLAVNQVRSLANLEALQGLTRLRVLSLYGLSRLTALPNFSSLKSLQRIEIGQMRRLADWTNLVTAPAVEELFLINKLDPDLDVLRTLSRHATLQTFEWMAGDEPDSKVQDARDAVDRPRATAIRPEDWLEQKT